MNHHVGALLSLLACAAPLAAEQVPFFPHPERIRYDAAGLQIDGRDTFIYSGAFHYFRCPRELWPERFRKIVAAGFNAVESYVPWNRHERKAPGSPADFSQVDLSELEAWMTMAESYGLYVIIRPGPYICAEWSGGGFPQWLPALARPAAPLRPAMWLQSDDPVYLDWARHWYAAVCRVVAGHQVTRRAPGAKGVILFQIENEYERIAWLPREAKTRQLVALADAAHAGGIDVPLFTCWTREGRNSGEPALRGVFDMMNFYPRWDIEKKLREFTAKQRREQPLAPVMSAETQGGWYSEVGGKLSADLDGVAPVQTQNLALYELQLGFSLINFYMLVGGTNFDDWASRQTTTSYDFAAAIHEDGGVDERYRRVAAIGALLRDHGAQLMRSVPVALTADAGDPAVQINARRAADGGRYLFVRTADRRARHAGRMRIMTGDGPELQADYDLEPFGSQILYLAPGVVDGNQGEWLPKPFPAAVRPKNVTSAVVLSDVWRQADPPPSTWTELKPGEPLERYGVVDQHLLRYRVTVPGGGVLMVGRTGEKVINNTMGDTVLVSAGGRLLSCAAGDREQITFTVPAGITEAELLFASAGQHQHTNQALEQHWNGGIAHLTMGGVELPRAFAGDERARGIAYSAPAFQPDAQWQRGTIGGGPVAARSEPLLSWYRMQFALPAAVPGTWVPWHLRLSARGDGFIYCNGHCLGRYWQAGPQHDFFVPECWLATAPGAVNAVAISLHPLDQWTGIDAASLVPAVEHAEVRE